MGAQTMRLFLVLLTLQLGCSAVTTTQPLPLTAQPADQEKLEGTWLMNGTEPVMLRFASNGIGQLASLQWDKDSFHVQRCELIFSDGENCRFLSIHCLEDDVWEQQYHFLRYTVTSDGDLVLWMPRPEAFEEEITAGRLQGVINGDSNSTSITVTDEPAALLKLIDDPDRLDLFEYTDPMVVSKLQLIKDR